MKKKKGVSFKKVKNIMAPMNHLYNDYVGIALSAPSGTGKSTLCQMLSKKYPELKISVSVTTRPKRENEIDGKHYYFLTLEKYQALNKNGELLETAEIYGNGYGTRKSIIEDIINKNQYACFDIDYLGVKQLQEGFFKNRLLTIFLLPPSIKELENRISKRSSLSPEVLKIRLHSALEEIKYCEDYDFVILNDDLEKTFNNLCNIYEVFFRIKNNKKILMDNLLPSLINK